MNTKVFSYKTYFALTVAIVFWASAFVGIRAGLEGYSPGALALFRFLVASVCMGIVYWRLPQRARFTRKDFCLLILFGAVGLGGYNIFLNYGELTIPSGIASFIISQSPLLTMIISVAMLGESFSLPMLLGILISIAGVGLIALSHDNNFQINAGLMYMLAATVISGFFSIMQKSFLTKYHAIDVTVFIIWGATLSLLFYLPDLSREISHAPLNATLAVVYLGVFPAAIAYIAWSYALAAISASRAVSFLYFMPVIATFLGWLFLGEIPAFLSLLGGLIALLGVWVANYR